LPFQTGKSLQQVGADLISFHDLAGAHELLNLRERARRFLLLVDRPPRLQQLLVDGVNLRLLAVAQVGRNIIR
jgi:hypothetical protein